MKGQCYLYFVMYNIVDSFICLGSFIVVSWSYIDNKRSTNDLSFFFLLKKKKKQEYGLGD